MGRHDFDALFPPKRPHVFEKICLSLDYESLKNCLQVNEAWKGALSTKAFQKKAKSLFRDEISEDEKKLRRNSKKGKDDEVRKLLSIGLLDAECADKYGWTLLHEAAQHGHTDVVKLLLDRGANPNKADEYERRTPLH